MPSAAPTVDPPLTEPARTARFEASDEKGDPFDAPSLGGANRGSDRSTGAALLGARHASNATNEATTDTAIEKANATGMRCSVCHRRKR